ncbi:MAG: hypothetical protein ACI4UN_03215, partial [Muribaculaceae bacterium]
MKKIALRFFSIFAAVMVALSVNAAGPSVVAKKAAHSSAGAGSEVTQQLSAKGSFKMAEVRKAGKNYTAFASVNNSKLGKSRLALQKSATVKGGAVPTFNAAQIYNASWAQGDYSNLGIYTLAADGSSVVPYYLNE